MICCWDICHSQTWFGNLNSKFIVDGIDLSDLEEAKDNENKFSQIVIRENEFITSSDASDSKIISSALTFRKMLIASIDDVRVLIVKLCDRLHKRKMGQWYCSHGWWTN